MVQLSILPPAATMYDALVRRDPAFEGLFVVGVKTTGIFCRPTCPARKPKPDSVEYFAAAQGALLSGYRACLRCRPLEPAGQAPAWLRGLLAEIEASPARRFTDADLEEQGLEPARVRRWFQSNHGMTFHAYQRARRLGSALGRIRQGAPLTDTAYDAGFESESGFRDAFAKLFGAPPGRARVAATPAMVTRISTPLGPMVAAATDRALLLLEFADRRMLERQIQRIRARLRATFTPGDNDVLARTQAQLTEYFDGRRRSFEVPLALDGSEFQRAVWQELLRIPYGETRSYSDQARAIGRLDALRAVARANGDNRIAIIVPCHRVIGADGTLTGYGGQLWRKRALLDLERGTRG
jgi:AraC family transcriptional regulator of adaptative response/methylated-DNA-[protein]-cysteine methyltransferase